CRERRFVEKFLASALICSRYFGSTILSYSQKVSLNFHGGNFATPHLEYYKNTVLEDTRAPDHGDLDILAEVLPAAEKRGVKVICWLEDVFRTDLPNIDKLQERELYGRSAETLCVNNPTTGTS